MKGIPNVSSNISSISSPTFSSQTCMYEMVMIYHPHPHIQSNKIIELAQKNDEGSSIQMLQKLELINQNQNKGQNLCNLVLKQMNMLNVKQEKNSPSKSNGWRSIIPFIIIILTFERDCHLFNHYLVWVDEFTIKLAIT